MSKKAYTATVDDTGYKRIQTDELWFESHMLAVGASEINLQIALAYLDIRDRTHASKTAFDES